MDLNRFVAERPFDRSLSVTQGRIAMVERRTADKRVVGTPSLLRALPKVSSERTSEGG
jgi:hypothetical protein